VAVLSPAASTGPYRSYVQIAHPTDRRWAELDASRSITDLSPQYFFQGHAQGKKNRRLLWPCAMITLSLSTNRDNYYAAVRTKLDLELEYLNAPYNVSELKPLRC
jgi:hypothetical protein